MHPLKYALQSFFVRARVAFKAGSDRLFDLLRTENIMCTYRDVVVFAHQQVENVDIIIPSLRPVNKEPRTGPLAQRIIHVFGIVRKHPKGAIAAHNRIGPGKALHQNSRNFQLPRRGLAIAALARQLINIINGPKADHTRIKHVVDKRLGVLT